MYFAMISYCHRPNSSTVWFIALLETIFRGISLFCITFYFGGTKLAGKSTFSTMVSAKTNYNNNYMHNPRKKRLCFQFKFRYRSIVSSRLQMDAWFVIKTLSISHDECYAKDLIGDTYVMPSTGCDFFLPYMVLGKISSFFKNHLKST